MPKSLPAVAYLLIIAIIASVAGGSLLFPAALITMLLVGVAGKKILNLRNRNFNEGVAIA